MKYKCTVAYDGFDYYGYQLQKHESKTIQQAIQEALYKMFNESIIIYGSGRTDRKVHALGQTFHFEIDKKIPLEAIKKGLNSILDDSIRIIDVCEVADEFHARYDVKRKQYIYKIKNSKSISPFDSRYYAQVKEDIDIDLLKKACCLFVGEHDFRNFTTNTQEEVHTFIKKIYKVKVSKKSDTIEILFEGTGFLRYMVRMMVGALLVVATQKKDLSYIESLLNLSSSEKCSYKAKPQGLYLKKVIY